MLGGKALSQMRMRRRRLEIFAFSISSLHISKHFGRVAFREAIVKSFGVLDMAVTAPGGNFFDTENFRASPKGVSYLQSYTDMLMELSCC